MAELRRSLIVEFEARVRGSGGLVVPDTVIKALDDLAGALVGASGFEIELRLSPQSHYDLRAAVRSFGSCAENLAFGQWIVIPGVKIERVLLDPGVERGVVIATARRMETFEERGITFRWSGGRLWSESSDDPVSG